MELARATKRLKAGQMSFAEVALEGEKVPQEAIFGLLFRFLHPGLVDQELDVLAKNAKEAVDPREALGPGTAHVLLELPYVPEDVRQLDGIAAAAGVVGADEEGQGLEATLSTSGTKRSSMVVSRELMAYHVKKASIGQYPARAAKPRALPTDDRGGYPRSTDERYPHPRRGGLRPGLHPAPLPETRRGRVPDTRSSVEASLGRRSSSYRGLTDRERSAADRQRQPLRGLEPRPRYRALRAREGPQLRIRRPRAPRRDQAGRDRAPRPGRLGRPHELAHSRPAI